MIPASAIPMIQAESRVETAGVTAHAIALRGFLAMRWSGARLHANFFAAGLALSLATLYRFSPQQYAFYPACPVFRYLHLFCPGCGTTRALAALLHGRIAEGFHYNPLTSLLLPAALGVFAFVYWNAMQKNELRWPSIPAAVWRCILLVVLAYGVYRNVAAMVL